MTPTDQIKKAFPIAPFVAPYTKGLRKSGDGWFIGFCPFHNADKPTKKTFWVNPAKGVCNCFVPRCKADKPMDVINFYARMQNISNQEAIDILKLKIKIGDKIA